MNGKLLWQIAATFASLSLVSFGGANAVVPEIHHQIVERLGWMNDTAFTSFFAISQAAPGPNVLLVSLIGWHIAGLAGLAIATLAMILPPSLLAFIAGRMVSRWQSTRWIKIAKAGLEPIALGLILASGVVMARAADHHALSVMITAALRRLSFSAGEILSGRSQPPRSWALSLQEWESLFNVSHSEIDDLWAIRSGGSKTIARGHA